LLDFDRINTRRIEVRHNRDSQLPLGIWAQPMIDLHLRMACTYFLAYVRPSRQSRAVAEKIEHSATHPSVFKTPPQYFSEK
jgi:hypothetical protein